MSILLLLMVGLGILSSSRAQQDPERDPRRRPATRRPIIVTATRLAQDPFEVLFAIERIDREQIRQRAYRTMPQVLRDVPGVMVQETAHGHGSPYIRGFTSFRRLSMIDGIRLNNSVFRPGPNQYWNTVDALSLDRIEVVKGPSSVLYGSIRFRYRLALGATERRLPDPRFRAESTRQEPRRGCHDEVLR